MTAWNFVEPWLSKLADPNYEFTAREFANLRTYLKGLDDGTISLFNLHLQNLILDNPLGVIYGGTGLSSIAQGDLLYGSAANVISKLTKNTTATRYLSNTGTSNNPAWAQIDLTNGVTGVLPIANGGTNSSTALVNGFAAITSGGKIIEDVTFIGMGRNRIINGAMIFDQANAQTDNTVNSTAVFNTSDMFTASGVAASGVFVMANDGSGPTNFSNSTRATCSTADASIGATDAYYIQTKLEGPTVIDFFLGGANAKTFTLSFWVKSSLTGTYTGSFTNATNRSYPFEYTINSASTWEQKTITATGDTTGTWVSTAGNTGLAINWSLAIGSNFQGTVNTWAGANNLGTSNQVNWMSSNSSRTWAITGIQLELGSTATAFEYRLYPVELILCQRYYEKSYALGTKPGTNTTTNSCRMSTVPLTSGGEIDLGYQAFKVPKRSSPTMTFYTPSGTSGKFDWIAATGTATARTTTANLVGTNGFSAFQTASTTDSAGADGQWVADARL